MICRKANQDNFEVKKETAPAKGRPLSLFRPKAKTGLRYAPFLRNVGLRLDGLVELNFFRFGDLEHVGSVITFRSRTEALIPLPFIMEVT